MKFLEQFEDLDLVIHGVRLPTFVVEDSYKTPLGISGDIDNYDFLRRLCLDGFKGLGLEKNSHEYKKYADRIKFELETIKDLGFVDYILLVWDVINFCQRNNIPTGYGRGSAAGSLVLFVIGVTKVDPIKYNLFFERFISKIRAKKKIVDGVTYLDGSLMCDVDIDICYYRRSEVIKYLKEKYSGKICNIATTTTLTGKLLMKECGKIIGGKTDDEMGRVSDMIPTLHGKVHDIYEAYNGIKKKDSDEWKLEPVKPFIEWCDNNPEVYEIALKLRDLIKNKGVHASALCISFEPLIDSTPTEFDSDKNEVTSYTMDWVALYSVKLDALGLRGASVVDDVCRNLGIKMSDIDFEDVSIYQQLQDLKTPHGIFQIEADTNYSVLKKVKPKNLEELSAVLALARPGALAFVDQYASFTNFGSYEAIHEFFDSILKPTGGVCIYQEQMMQMAHKVGFTLDEAEILRRIVGKKKLEEVKSWQGKIDDKIKENNLDPQIATILWKILEDSASYSFNKSHSLAYSCLSAATIYLKFKYPQQFYLSLLKMSRNETKPIEEISKVHMEMFSFGIKLLRPHLMKSQLDFTIEGPDIRFGLLSIKGISDKSIEKLQEFRNEYATKFEVFEGAQHAGLNIGVLCALIQAGACEGFKESRSKIVYEAQVWNKLSTNEKKLAANLANEFEFDLVKIILALAERKDDKGKPYIKESRLATIRKHCEKYKQIYELNSKSESFANWYYEKKLLGFTHNKTLVDIFIGKCPNLNCIRDIHALPENNEAYFVASVNKDSQMRTSKAGNRYLVFDCSDETGMINVKVFDSKRRNGGQSPLAACLSLNDNKTPKEDNIVIVQGQKKEGNCVFGDIFAIQTNRIYTRLVELTRQQKEDELDKTSKKT